MMHYIRSSADDSVPQYFSGIAFAEDCAVLSFSGLAEYIRSGRNILALVDGRFSLCAKIEEYVYFLTDHTGQDCWFYFQDREFYAVSNSFYALAEYLHKKNGALTLRRHNAFMFGLNHSSGDQPYCNDTMLEGIRILPRDSYIVIRESRFHINKHDSIKPIETYDEYIQSVEGYIDRWSSRILTINELVGANRVRCDISGGVDSRIVFGLTNKSKLKFGEVKYSSNKKWESDYRIASILSAHYGFNIDNSEVSVGRSLGAQETLKIYLNGNAGIYRNLYYPKHRMNTKSLHLHGGGGENLRGLQLGSAWKYLNRIKQFFNSLDDFEEFKLEYLTWYDQNDIDPHSDDSTLLHYRNFRGRFHFGRNWFRELVNPLLTPLAATSAERMSDYLISKNLDPRALQFDLLYLCDPVLAFLPFDSEAKAFRFEDLNNSIKNLKRMQLKFENIKVFGEFQSSVHESGKGDPEAVINSFLYEEVMDYLNKAPSSITEQYPWLHTIEKQRIYGFVSVLKLSKI
jgi:hypothetical protein